MSKVVLVTGASSGIGKAIATYLAAQGLKVYGTSRNPKEGETYPFTLIAMDVTSVESIQTAAEFILKQEGRIDVLINNAGLGITGPLEETPLDMVEKVLQTNVVGILKTIQGIVPIMKKQRSGLIINISSIAANMGLPFRGIYCASKAAVESITEALSMELKPYSVNTCTIQPGDYATSINQNRLMTKLPESSSYYNLYNKVANQINEEVQHAGDPEEVGKLAYAIINTKNPKLQYKSGKFLQKLSVMVKKIVPQRMFENILLNHYKLK